MSDSRTMYPTGADLTATFRGASSAYSGGSRPDPRVRSHAARMVHSWIATGTSGMVVWLSVHAVVFVFLQRSPNLAAMHALATLGVGVWAALRWPPHLSVIVAAYIAGAEVFWRMSSASIPWEFGKYAVVLILGLALIRSGKLLRIPGWLLVYGLLLLPSIPLAIEFFRPDFDAIRQNILGNLSGPLSLFVSVWFCSSIRIERSDLWRSFVAALGPLVGIATITASTTYGAQEIRFSFESNLITSGGFGPNQVSAMLGLGVLFCFLLLILGSLGRNGRIFLLLVMLFLGVQSAMTFSRGGLYGAAGAASLGAFFLLRDSRAVLRLITALTVTLIVANFVVLPRLDSFTGGAITTRFADTQSTGRAELMMIDVELWLDNPIFGVGPGVSKFNREGFGYRESAAHTEPTRMLAEHGLLGLVALLALLRMSWSCFRHSQTRINRVLVVSLISWSLLFMMHAATRMSAAGFIFGLAFVACRALPPRTRWTTPAHMAWSDEPQLARTGLP